MSKAIKSVVATGVLAVSVLASGQAAAEFSGNIGVTSNYIWRGVTQTNDDSAISGGLDYSHDSGFYIGTWASNASWTTPVSYELDGYLGFSGEASGIGYDVGYIRYTYPNATSNDFGEVYVGGSYGMFSGKVSYDSENKNMYYEGAVDFPVTGDVSLGLHVGHYNFDTGTDYSDYSATVSKGDFSFAVSDTSENVAMGQTDNYRVAVSWSKSF